MTSAPPLRHPPTSALPRSAPILATVVAALGVGLYALAVPAATTAVRSPQPTGSGPAVPPRVACLDLPISSAVVDPRRCWRTGPQAWVIAGTRPPPSRAGVVVAVAGQADAVLPVAGGVGAALRTGRAAARSGGVPGGADSLDALGRSGQAAQAAPAPLATASYYVYGTALTACTASPTTGCPLYADGAAEPDAGGIVVLDFGAPCSVPGSSPTAFGTQLFGTTSCTADPRLLPLVEAWLAGYATTHGRASPQIRLAIGTSNSLTAADPPGFALTAAQMTAAGGAWVASLLDQVAVRALAAPVAVWGGSDMEQSASGNWYGPDPTLAWVRGFAAAADPAGAVEGCLAGGGPRLADYGDDVVGNGGWSAAQIYDVAYGLPAACALPEIYYPSMAQEWAALNSWAAAHPALAPRGPILVSGVMDEPGAGLAPTAAWSQLERALGQTPAVPALTVIGSALATVTGLTGIVPTVGSTAGGTVVSLSGSGLAATTRVHFGLRSAAFRVLSGSMIQAVSPSQPAGGSVAVTVTTPAGTTAAATAPQFLYLGGGPYHPLPPVRVLDTRTGLGAPAAPIPPQGALTLHLAGVDGVPRHALGAVFLNVTVVRPAVGGFLTVYPAGQPRPLAASVNFAAGRTTATLVAVVVGAQGDVTIANGPGTVEVVADLYGWASAASVRHLAPTPTPTPVATPTPTPTATPTPVGSPTPPSALTPPAPTPPPVPATTATPTPSAVATPSPTPPPAPTPSPTPPPTPRPTPVPMTAAGLYVPVPPVRIADTRPRASGPYAGQTLGPGGTLTVRVAGAGGVPLVGAEAVALNRTVTGPTGSGYVSVFPAGGAAPGVSSLNYASGETVANRVVVGLGPGGAITVANAQGRVNVLIDVDGWFTAPGASPGGAAGGQLHPLAPVRILDTRPGSGTLDAGEPLGAGAVLPVALAGRDGLPASGVLAVILHVTVAGGSTAGYLTCFADGAARPTTSDLNWAAGQTVGNLVVVPVGPDGAVDLGNATGTVNAIVDLVGWFG